STPGGGDTDHLITGKDIVDIDTDSNTISENAAINDLVHLTANVVDEDGDKVTYELTNDFHGWFQIDANSGVVSVKVNIDYDSTNLTDHKATVSVKATSTDLSTTSKDFEIVITEADGTTPGGGDTDHLITGKDITDTDLAANEINENAAVNDIVHLTANVLDEDGDKVTYELTNDFHGWFQIDSDTGIVTVKGNIDYDSTNLTDHKATVSVKATSTDLSTTSKDFEIEITEADGTTPGGGDTDHLITGKDIADIDTDSNTISENAAINDIVHLTANVVDEDGDKVTYELTNDFNGWFQIDSDTGIVTVKGNIDYDSTDLTDHKATVIVKATSTDLSHTSKDFEIVITEADGSTPGGGDTDHLITGKDIADIDT
ncbi:cadherin repeat domain-containing protein, partial [Labilibaculum sp. DW002]